MPESLQGRFTLLFVAFALLVLVSVGATYFGLETQRQDALIINLAGRQRMLIQQMGRLAFEAGAGEDTVNTALQESEKMFAQTLQALRQGGPAPYPPSGEVTLPLPRNPQVGAALNQVSLAWNEYRLLLDTLQNTSPQSPEFLPLLQTVQQRSSALVQQADTVVRLYEATSTAKVNRLRLIQIVFLLSALALLGLGVTITRQSVLQPLQRLVAAAARLGQNDLENEVRAEGPAEMRVLAEAFDTMRLSLRSSRQELISLNESLEERVARRTHELEMLNEVSREISSRLELQQVLNSVTEKARLLLGGEVASLCLVDEERHWLKLQALSGPQQAIHTPVVAIDDELVENVLQSDHALPCGLDTCRGGCRMLNDPYRTSHLAAPLRVGEHVIGALCVGSAAPCQFAEDAASMLTKLANVAAIALENARLYAQVERVATLEERRRLAAEMHDGLGQTLSYLGLMTDQIVEFLAEGQDEAALERLYKARETIGKATREVRRAINSLMDETPPAQDLSSRLREMVEEFAAEHDLKVAWQMEAGFGPKCSPQTAEQVLNIAREALNNIAHHAQAQRVTMQLGQERDRFSILIEDDGQGFDPSQATASGHFGLQIMRARAAHIGGQLEVESAPGKGTRVRLNFSDGENQ
jgi:two-component system nitrate/nitrite sensor histidine kinase NarX